MGSPRRRGPGVRSQHRREVGEGGRCGPRGRGRAGEGKAQPSKRYATLDSRARGREGLLLSTSGSLLIQHPESLCGGTRYRIDHRAPDREMDREPGLVA